MRNLHCADLRVDTLRFLPFHGTFNPFSFFVSCYPSMMHELTMTSFFRPVRPILPALLQQLQEVPVTRTRSRVSRQNQSESAHKADVASLQLI